MSTYLLPKISSQKGMNLFVNTIIGLTRNTNIQCKLGRKEIIFKFSLNNTTYSYIPNLPSAFTLPHILLELRIESMFIVFDHSAL